MRSSNQVGIAENLCVLLACLSPNHFPTDLQRRLLPFFHTPNLNCIVIQVLLRRVRQELAVLQSPHSPRAWWQGLPHGVAGHLRAVGQAQTGNGCEEAVRFERIQGSGSGDQENVLLREGCQD